MHNMHPCDYVTHYIVGCVFNYSTVIIRGILTIKYSAYILFGSNNGPNNLFISGQIVLSARIQIVNMMHSFVETSIHFSFGR